MFPPIIILSYINYNKKINLSQYLDEKIYEIKLSQEAKNIIYKLIQEEQLSISECAIGIDYYHINNEILEITKEQLRKEELLNQKIGT